MKIKAVVKARQQHMLNPIGQLRCDSAMGVAWESTVQITLIDGGGAQPGHGRREIHRRQDHQSTLDVRWLQAADEVTEPDLAFPFIAVVARHHQDAGSFTVLDAGDRHRNPAVGRTLDRVRYADKATGLARRVQINVCA